MSKPIMETDRLILRELEVSDYDNLCRILQDDDVMYAYEGAFNKDEVYDWLNKQLVRYKNDGIGLYGVILKENGEFIGQCGLTIQLYNNQKVVEIGYLFRKEFWHKGYASEAALACKEYAFNNLHIKEVYSIIRDSNGASQKVAIRIGLTQIDSFIKHYRGVDMPHVVFSVKNIS